MTEVIEKARQKLKELEAEAERLRTFLRVYADLAGDKPVDNDSSEQEAGDEEPTASPRVIVESAKALMRQRGRPLTRSQLLKLLRGQGLNLPGKDATKNIGTVIWRSKQFDNISGEGYWPKEFERWIGQRVKEPDLPLP